ncbi:MAG: hypothetical protein IPP74_09475 [Alphaproteobacteria bacterium]|nr:hypothetical protein [Alphaproteobacteria bacterium]
MPKSGKVKRKSYEIQNELSVNEDQNSATSVSSEQRKKKSIFSRYGSKPVYGTVPLPEDRLTQGEAITLTFGALGAGMVATMAIPVTTVGGMLGGAIVGGVVGGPAAFVTAPIGGAVGGAVGVVPPAVAAAGCFGFTYNTARLYGKITRISNEYEKQFKEQGEEALRGAIENDFKLAMFRKHCIEDIERQLKQNPDLQIGNSENKIHLGSHFRKKLITSLKSLYAAPLFTGVIARSHYDPETKEYNPVAYANKIVEAIKKSVLSEKHENWVTTKKRLFRGTTDEAHVPTEESIQFIQEINQHLFNNETPTVTWKDYDKIAGMLKEIETTKETRKVFKEAVVSPDSWVISLAELMQESPDQDYDLQNLIHNTHKAVTFDVKQFRHDTIKQLKIELAKNPAFGSRNRNKIAGFLKTLQAIPLFTEAVADHFKYNPSAFAWIMAESITDIVDKQGLITHEKATIPRNAALTFIDALCRTLKVADAEIPLIDNTARMDLISRMRANSGDNSAYLDINLNEAKDIFFLGNKPTSLLPQHNKEYFFNASSDSGRNANGRNNSNVQQELISYDSKEFKIPKGKKAETKERKKLEFTESSSSRDSRSSTDSNEGIFASKNQKSNYKHREAFESKQETSESRSSSVSF